jgi:hypothetical protein
MDEVPFFPPTRPGTLFYSHVIQYHVLVGNTSQQRTRQELFGSNNASVAGRFGGLSGRLYDAALSRRYATPGEMLRSHTLVPYYAAFLPESTAAIWEEELLWRTGRTLQRFLGGPSRSLCRHHLHQCLSCIDRDYKEAGVTSWHLAHQLPGVAVCPWHWEPLIGSCEHCQKPIATEFRWGLPTQTCRQCCRPIRRTQPNDVSETYGQFVTRSEVLLAKPSSTIAPAIRLEKYRDRLSQLGNTPSLSLGARLGQLVAKKWQVATLSELQNFLDLPVTETLLERAAKGTDALAFPALHLILSDALDLDLFDAAASKTPNAEFDEASVAIWRDLIPPEMRALIALPQELAKRAPEIVALGKALQAQSIPPYLAAALLGGITINYVHSYFGVSVQRLAAAMDACGSSVRGSMPPIPTRSVPIAVSTLEARKATRVAAARKKLLSLIASGEASGRAQVERTNGSLMTLLRRLDREWLDRTLPTAKRRNGRRISDLTTFDTDLATKLVDIQREASQQGKQRAPSVSLACKIAGFRLDYYFARGLLPQSRALIQGSRKLASRPCADFVGERSQDLDLAS